MQSKGSETISLVNIALATVVNDFFGRMLLVSVWMMAFS
jgi:hypothetical protein